MLGFDADGCIGDRLPKIDVRSRVLRAVESYPVKGGVPCLVEYGAIAESIDHVQNNADISLL